MNNKTPNKLQTIHLLHSFIPSNKNYLENLFIMANKLHPIINEKTLENSCIIQKMRCNGICIEKLIDYEIVKDLENLNDQIEQHNLIKEMNEIKYLEDTLKESFHNISRMKSKEILFSNLDQLSYEGTNHISIIEDLFKAESSFGKFELIQPKVKDLGKLIDEAVKNIKISNQRDSIIKF